MGDWLHVGCLSSLADRYSDAGACARVAERESRNKDEIT